MMKKNKQKTLNLTISCGSGGGSGSYLCYERVTKEVYDYFQKRKLDLEKYALDDGYARKKKIPENMEPFNPGERASFGSYECVMSVGNLRLRVEDEESKEVFYGDIPNLNIKKDLKEVDLLKKREKGIYAVGYEGLEDCYISGQIELDSDFDIKKFKVKYGYMDYELRDIDFISSISYDQKEVDWGIDYYEGTGDNSFEFVVID